jgi:hypothetical protein
MNQTHKELDLQDRRSIEPTPVSKDDLISMPAQEDMDKRTETSKVFSLGENRFQAVLFAEPVHYLDPDTGRYEAIDNRLDDISDEKGRHVLRNRKNPHLKVSMAAADQDESVVIEDESGHRISWAFLGAEAVSPAALRDEKAQKAAQLDRIEQALVGTHAGALYSGIFPGADLKCSIQGHMFKDELIFSSPESVKTIRLQLRAPGLKPSKDEQGSILIADENGKIVYTLPMPFMKDAQEESIFGSVEVSLEQGKHPDAWLIAYTPDKTWLDGAKYPVILDPVVITKKHSTAIEDNYITSAQPNTVQPYAGAAMKVTYNSGSWGTSKSFIKFLNADLPPIDSSYYVTKAYMFVQTRSAPTSPASVYLKEVMGPWNSTTITYNNAPALNAFSLDYTYMNAANTWYSYDISNLVRKWYAGTNYGFALEANTGTFMELSTSDDSYNKPYVMISYVSLAGLESFLAYESQSVGLAGTGHVSLYNGNLIFEHQDTVCNGNILPVSVSHFYNSCYRNDDAFGVGKGWKTNYHQCLHRETLPDGTGNVLYYVYTDGDGTRHYFKQTGGVWKDQSGLELTLTISGSLVTIRDKGDNTMTFDLPTVEFNGNYANVKMIKTFADPHGNSIVVSTDANRLLTNIEDGAERNTGFSSYSSRMSTIYSPGYGESGYCGFEYNTLGQMTKIWQLDGEPGIRESTYTYNAQGLLETATNHDGLKITYEYYLTREPYRVKKMTVSNGSTPGNSRLYEYGDNLTVVTDLTVPNGKKLFYHFNDYGNVVSVNDQLGYAAFTKYNSSQPMNHPEVVSRMQRVVCNLLRNHGFENSDSWSLSSAMSYATDAKYMGNRSLKVTTQGVTGMHIASQSVLI